jgi:hypothetical protein
MEIERDPEYAFGCGRMWKNCGWEVLYRLPIVQKERDGKNIQQRGFANGHPLDY